MATVWANPSPAPSRLIAARYRSGVTVSSASPANAAGVLPRQVIVGALVLTIIVGLVFVVASVWGAQTFEPRWVIASGDSRPAGADAVIDDPRIATAWHGVLDGAPHVLSMRPDVPFDLSLALLLPASGEVSRHLHVTVTKDGAERPIATLDGSQGPWVPFREPWGGARYLRGPEVRVLGLSAGSYAIRVTGTGGVGKYVLVVGDTAPASVGARARMAGAVPSILRDFLGESPVRFLGSPLGAMQVAVMLAVGAVGGHLFRLVLRRLPSTVRRRATPNMGLLDRGARLTIAVVTLAWAVTGSWEPTTIAIAGFVFYEGLSRWCVLHAAVGHSTCPV